MVHLFIQYKTLYNRSNIKQLIQSDYCFQCLAVFMVSSFLMIAFIFWMAWIVEKATFQKQYWDFEIKWNARSSVKAWFCKICLHSMYILYGFSFYMSLLIFKDILNEIIIYHLIGFNNVALLIYTGQGYNSVGSLLWCKKKSIQLIYFPWYLLYFIYKM